MIFWQFATVGIKVTTIVVRIPQDNLLFIIKVSHVVMSKSLHNFSEIPEALQNIHFLFKNEVVDFYLSLNGEQVGPYRCEDIQGWLNAGHITLNDLAWFEGCSDWVTVSDIPGIQNNVAGHATQADLIPPFEAYEGNEPFIFVSYAHKDAEVVYSEITELHNTGYKVWYDEGIEASNEWPEEIANAVINCSVFLAFISPRSTTSVNCRNEINLALNEAKPFLAIHLEESALPPGLRLRMGDLQAILRYKLTRERYVKKVQGTLDQLLGIKSLKQKFENSSKKPKGKAEEVRPRKQSPDDRKTIIVYHKKPIGLKLAIVFALVCIIFIFGVYFQDDTDDEVVENKNSKTATHANRSLRFSRGQSWVVPKIDLEMLWCPAGSFLQGSPKDEDGRLNNETQHKVTLTQGFFLGKYEVTQQQFAEIIGNDPSAHVGLLNPVEQVSWEESMAFCEKLSSQKSFLKGLPKDWIYTLPTEAEWEYACRAGSKTLYSFGNSISTRNANYKASGISKTLKVGKYPPNSWGLYDMHGNVAEWVLDGQRDYTKGQKVDPIGPDSKLMKLRRGGAWNLNANNLRSAYRSTSAISENSVGFRLCLKRRKK